MNISSTPSVPAAEVFALLGQPERLKIVLAIGRGHACVCHLTSAIGLRQAYISQQLMLLRAANLVTAERCGRHIFYTLNDPGWLDLIEQAAVLAGTPLPHFDLPDIEGCCYSTCTSSSSSETR